MDQYAKQRALKDDDFISWGKPKAPYKGTKGKGWRVLPDETETVVVLSW